MELVGDLAGELLGWLGDLLGPLGEHRAQEQAPARHHDDTDVAVRIDDLARLRTGLSDWQLWEAIAGRCAHCCPAPPHRGVRPAVGQAGRPA